jgi:hypothetical protein
MSDVPTRLLREALRGRAAASSAPECLDPETAAAWADHRLSARERAEAERHVADCARCQALIAALARTTPPPAPARPWWLMPAIGWLVPAAAAAVAVAVWVEISSRPRSAATDRGAAPAAVTIARAPAAEARALPAEQKEPGSALARRANAEAPPQVRDVATGKRESPALQRDADQGALHGSSAAAPVQAYAELDRARGATAPSGTASAPTVSDTLAAAKSTLAARPVPSAAPAPQLADSRAAEPAIAAPAAAPPAAASSTPSAAFDARAASASRVAAPRSFARSEPVAVNVISPTNNFTRWRIPTSIGVVERSTNGGATWERQSTGASVIPVAGASPSPLVCWLVGPKGLVLRTIDGRTWERVAFPEAIDLTAIAASDEQHATVKTAEGRAFTTADGGKTWTPN